MFVLHTQPSQVLTSALCSVRDAAQKSKAIIEPENIISVVPRSLPGDLKGKIKLLLTLRKMNAPKFSLLSVSPLIGFFQCDAVAFKVVKRARMTHRCGKPSVASFSKATATSVFVCFRSHLVSISTNP